MKRGFNNKSNYFIAGIIACFCLISVGYATLTQQLKINGIVKTTGSWDIKITNITAKATGSASNKVEPTGIGTTTATFNVDVYKPGDAMQYAVTVSNSGNIDAIVNNINILGVNNSDLKVKIDDLKVGHQIKAGSFRKFFITIEFDYNATSTSNGLIETITLDLDITQENNNNVIAVDKITDESCFTFESSTGKITNYNVNCGGTDVVIPSTIGGVEVKSIGNNSFQKKGLTNVVIPNTVTEIGGYSFLQNNLITLTIPNSVDSIGNDAFSTNKITNIVLPENKYIKLGGGCFNDNQLPDDRAFIYKINTDGSIDNSTVVGYGGAKRDNIVIPNNVKTISSWAFSRAGIISVIIPSNVTSIGSAAFVKNSSLNRNLKTITNNAGRSFNWGMIINNSSGYNFITGTVTNAVGNVEVNGINITKEICFTFNSSTETITDYDETCGGTAISIPSMINETNVTTIGFEAFRSKGLLSVILPNSIKKLKANSFLFNKISSLTIPDSVISIESQVFNGNQLPDNQAFIYKRNNDGSIDNTTIVSYGGAKRDNVVIPDGVKTLGSWSFSNNDLTSVQLPDGLISFGEGAFSNNKLTTVDLPSTLTSIGTTAFSYNKLVNIEIPSNVNSIGTNAFKKSSNSNSGLTKIINTTGKSFDWGNIINKSSGYNFATGTVINDIGNVEITSK